MKQGLSLNRAVLLWFVRDMPGMSIAQLLFHVNSIPAEMKRHILANATNNTLYQAANYLEKAGYVRIEPPKQLYLTEKGEGLLKELDALLGLKRDQN